MTRTLEEIPDTVIGDGKAIRFGSYRGAFPRVDLGPITGPVTARFRKKRWIYVIVVREPWVVTLAMVHLGYLANGFIHVYDHGRREFVAEHTVLRTPLALRFGDLANHRFARFLTRPLTMTMKRPVGRGATEPMVVTARSHGRGRPTIELDASLDPNLVPPSITAVAKIPGGTVNVTEKRGPFGVRGKLVVDGTTIDLEGGFGAYDSTQGLLARDTRWRWAFALGKDAHGERFALNLVDGFVGEAECAVSAFGDLHPLPEAHIRYDAARPLEPWTVRTDDGAVDLRFEPGALLTEARDYKLIATKFLQPTGRYFGTVKVAGRALSLDGAFGVAEDQALTW